MKLKVYNRAPSRIALAGLLAAISCSSFAQAPMPGSVASAQAQSQGASVAPRPAVPAAKGQSAFAPAPQPSVYPAGANGAAAPAPGEGGRLKPRVIHPIDLTDEGSEPSGDVSRPGARYVGPGMPQRSPQTGGFGSRGGVSSYGPASPAGKTIDPFSPAGALQPPTAQYAQTSMPPPDSPALARAKKVKESKEEGPSINLQCTTPDIKEQGVFVGKIQNRYVYKYKSQYCFDVTP